MNTERYSNLIIIQYQNEMNRRFIEALVGMPVELTNEIFARINGEFDIDKAVGKQLDMVGDYIGFRRDFYKGINVDDDIYRFFLKIKILKNKITHRNPDLQKLLKRFFNDEIIFLDNHNMSISYTIMSVHDELIKDILKDNKYLLPVSAGVYIYLITTVDEDYVFSYRSLDKLPIDKARGYSRHDDIIDGKYLDINNFI